MPVVPSKLHSELAEYSSLLRALRANNTLDISTHLTNSHSQHHRQSSSESEGHQSELEDKPKPKKKTKDNWTRWPLLAADVHTPEWSLQDEIILILSQSTRSHPTTTQQHTDDDGDEAADDIEEAHHFLDNIATSTSSHLSQILDFIAAHIPPVAPSMQDRLGVIGWESVLEVVSVSGVVDERTVKIVKQRMEAIYGPSQTLALHRLHIHAKRKLAADDLSFLSFPDAPPVPDSGTNKRRKKTSKKSKKDMVDETPP